MIATALLGAALLAASPVLVESDGCPSGQAIERRIEAMLASAPPATAPDVARVYRAGDLLHIGLTSADGAVIAERSLPYTGTCAELGEVVAVVVASWESDVHPEFARPSADLVPAGPAVPASIAPSPWALDASLGAGASLADTWSFGGALAVAWFPRGAGLGLRLFGLGETPHTATVGTHQAHWQRWTVGLGAAWRFSGAATSFDLHGGGALGILHASGVGFDQDQSDSSLAAAALLGARFSLWLARRWAVYAEVTGSYCPRDQALHAPPGTDYQVPHFEGLFSLGVAARQTPATR